MNVIKNYLTAEQELKSAIEEKLQARTTGQVELCRFDFNNNKTKMYAEYFLYNDFKVHTFDVAEFES